MELSSTAHDQHISVNFRTCSIEQIRAIFDEVRKDIWPAIEARKLQLPIDQVYKFADIGKAFEHTEANSHLGKIVVTL
jgi:NADPH2:quinone reductase